MMHLNSAQLLGLINALRTGNPTLDFIAAFLLPIVFQKMIQDGPAFLRKLFAKKTKSPLKVYQRSIVYRTCQNSSGLYSNADTDTVNLYLIRAIKLFVHRKCKLTLEDANMVLTSVSSVNGQMNQRNNQNNGGNGMVDALKSYEIVETPLENVWHHLSNYNVDVYVCDTLSGGNQSNESSKDGNEGGKNSNRSVEVKLKSNVNVETINTFVKVAYDWYVDEIRKAENKDRYMLDIIEGRSSRSSCSYTAYMLGNEKTFDTMFSHECRKLIKIVDQFQSKQGKYAIKGYPYKLGIMLTGPPGTGKTSLIKALSHRTGRHIVNVNLARIQSNRELMEIFFNKTYQITSANTSHLMKLEYNQIIFVLEDVDSASDVVLDRNLLKKKLAEEKLKAEKDKTSVLDQSRGIPHRASRLPSCDDLNLSGLLNVLDGVVETPGRIVIMSTNHPELLDRALIRPGRIDKTLELGYMIAPDVIPMVEHYFQESLSARQKKCITAAICDDKQKVTPAQVEQLAMEEDLLEDFINRFCSLDSADSSADSSICLPENTSRTGFLSDTDSDSL